MKLIWYPADGSDPIEFTTGNADLYKFLKNYSGFLGPAVKHQTVKSPNQHGASYLGTTFEPREISFDVMVRTSGTDALQDLLDTQRDDIMKKFDASLGIGSLVWEQENGTQYLLNCIANGQCPVAGSSSQERGYDYQRLTFPMIGYDPFWYSGSPHRADFSFTVKSFFPFNFPFNFQSSVSPKQNLTNIGSHSAPVYALFTGPLTDPVLTNNLTGKTLTLDITIAAGETFEVDTDENELYATYHATGGDENGFPYIGAATTLAEFMISPGVNSVALSAASYSTGAGARVVWSDKYAGV